MPWLVALAAWCAASVPLALFVGRFIGNAR